jgi:hypothetical protein
VSGGNGKTENKIQPKTKMKFVKLLIPVVRPFALVFIAILLLNSGCAYLESAHVHGGHSEVATGDGATATAIQSQDPKAATTQTVTTENLVTHLLTNGVTETSQSKKTISTTIGASQKNIVGEMTAKLASMRWLQWIGILFVAFGIASLAYPPLKLIVNSVTTSAWCIAAGGALIFLPVLVVGHEILILSVAAGVTGLWWFAHTHGGVTAELATLKAYVLPAATPPAPAPAAPASNPGVVVPATAAKPAGS